MRAWVLCLAWLSALAWGQTLSLTDGVGQVVTLSESPKRIAALAPHAVEMLFALGLGDRIVATVAYADYPEAAKRLPTVGDAFNVSLETLWAAAPDLIVVWGDASSPALRQSLARRAPVFVSQPRSLVAVAEELRQLARLAPAQTAGPLARLEAEWAEPLAATAAGRRVLPLVSLAPPMALGQGHFFTSLLDGCGARHALPELVGVAPLVSEEVLWALAAEPDPPLAVVMSVEPEASLASLPSGLPWHRLDPDLTARPGPRLFQGQRALCAGLAEAAAE